MKLDKALQLATLWKHRLLPHCDRIEIAGSIRRASPEVKDIELVCIPKEREVPQLFNVHKPEMVRSDGFIEALRLIDGEIECLAGDAWKGKYIKLYLVLYDIKIDIFIASAENWGHILAIRTGNKDYSHKVLACGWAAKGYHSAEGFLRDQEGAIIPVREEEDLFRLIGVKYVEPQLRTV